MEGQAAKYKNIVFDMGRVLIEYDPDAVTRQYTDDPHIIREVHNVLFCSGEWYMLDAGLVTEDYALAKVLPRFETDKERAITEQCFANWHRYNMWAKAGMAEVIAALKARGHGLYVLSNASLRLPKCYREVIPNWELFDGIFFSAEERCMKPQEEIYRRFFARYQLNPEDCYFIDDLEPNIAGAKACGMDGYVFADGDVERLKTVLGLV